MTEPLADAVLPSARLVLVSIPLPDSEIVVGLLTALLFTVTDPVREPLAVGWKVTVTVQLAFTARLLPQLLVCVKSPLAVIDVIDADAVPLLVIVVDCELLFEPTTVAANERLPGLAFKDGPGAVPVPLSATVFVVPPALTVSEPLRLPFAVGLNVTCTLHEPFAGIELPQLLVWAKSPLVEIDDTDAAEPVGFDTVTVCAELVVPVVTEPKLSAPGEVVTPSFGYGGHTAAGHGPQ